jgi:hypothetical protein
MSYDTWKMSEPPEYGVDPREEEGEDEPAPFALAPKGTNPDGCALRRYLPTSLHRDVMLKHFGTPDPVGAFYEPENGYDGDEWIFLSAHDSSACFSVYSRWGLFRMGANASDDDVDEFMAWLEEKLNVVLRSS